MHDATWDDYTRLHNLMAEAGFQREIVGARGGVYDLPDAEYFLDGVAMSAEHVRDVVVRIASAVRPVPHVLVTEGATFAWQLHQIR